MTATEMMGYKSGRLTVIARAGTSGRRAMWLCACSCGGEITTAGNSLRSGRAQSCGCLRAEANTRHGHAANGTVTPEYKAWHSMWQRCTVATDKRFRNYGARGITVCERWQTFENFLADMGPRLKGRSLDRKDNNGNYEPGNCHWATAEQQARNTRRTKLTASKVREIKELLRQRLSHSKIARRFGVSKGAVSGISNGTKWADVQ